MMAALNLSLVGLALLIVTFDMKAFCNSSESSTSARSVKPDHAGLHKPSTNCTGSTFHPLAVPRKPLLDRTP